MIAANHAFAERILSLVPINSLKKRLQRQVLTQGELLKVRSKTIVFQLGARDPYTFYLLDGELDLQAKESSPVRMRAGDENARRALAQLQPRRYTAVAITPVTMFRIERAALENILADEQVLEDSGADMDVRELEDDEQDDESDWMSRLLSSELFMRLPHENIQRFFTELVALEVAKDDLIVEQGAPGDFLYIVAEGHCVVLRRAPGGGPETRLAVLNAGDTFGEDALISNSPRNASVRMLSHGMLMRLPKAEFEELVSNPTLKPVPWSEACKLAADGARWLDVRFADEHQTDGIEGSVNAPLNNLRQQLAQFAPNTRFIVYCDSGARSSAGAFLMTQKGFEACYLAGGLQRSPLGATAEAAAVEPIASKPNDIAAATGPAFDFEFTAGDEPVEEPAADDAVVTNAEAGEVADAAPLDAVAEAKTAAASMPAVQMPPARVTPHPQMAKVRAALAALKTERDKAAAFAKRAADAARELKRRNEELNKIVRAERERREQLDQELAATKADAERKSSMEQQRLSGELTKAATRIEALQLERDHEKEQAAAGLAQARAQVDDNQSRLQAALKDKEQAAAMHRAAEAAWQESLQRAQSEAKAARTGIADFEKELAATRDRIAEFEQRDREQAELLLTETARIKLLMTQDQLRVEQERDRLEEEREQLNIELERMRQERQEREAAEASVREERATLESQIVDVRARDKALKQRELELNDASRAAENDSQQRAKMLSDRESNLSAREQALSEEKALWQETVEKAISDERDRLQSEHARFREEAEASAEQRLLTLLEERTQELAAKHEERAAQMREQVEAHVAKLLADFDMRLESVRSDYETQLNEQEAMLEDERRRLEAETVRLRAALADARQTSRSNRYIPTLEDELSLSTPDVADAPALEFELDESADAVVQGTQTDDEYAVVSTAADLVLDLQIENTAREQNTHTGLLAAAEEEIAIPLLELPDTQKSESSFEHRPNEKRDRVISPNQLVEIRARMQEKIRAAKSKAS